MSKVAITGNASGTGTFTLAAPNSNSDRTLTLPDNTGTILTNATTAGFPAGSVLQVVQATYATETQVASTSFADSGLSASITPTSASSKILILVSQTANTKRATNNSIRGDVRLMRNSTEIFVQNGVVGIRAGTSAESDILNWGMYSGVYLDSPSTTSSVAYKTQGKVSTTSNSGLIEFQGGGTNSSMVLLEIAA